MKQSKYTSHLAAQIEANEIYASISSKQTARKLLKVAEKMKKEIFKINPVSEETEKMSDAELLEALAQ